MMTTKTELRTTTPRACAAKGGACPRAREHYSGIGTLARLDGRHSSSRCRPMDRWRARQVANDEPS